MGFDGLFFARNDYDDKNQRLKDNMMEMVWRPSPSLGNISDLFTGILLFHYGPPPGFCFDLLCADPPIKVTWLALNYPPPHKEFGIRKFPPLELNLEIDLFW